MKIDVSKREVTGKQVNKLRKEGLIPASIFGPNYDSVNVSVNKRDFAKLYKEVGHNNIFDIAIEGGKSPFKALVKDVQEDTLKGEVISVSFYKIDENKKLKVEVPVKFVGESKAVKNGLGFLVTLTESVPIYCLPKDILHEIVINLDELEEVNSSVSYADIKLGENIDLDPSIEPTSVIVRVAPPQKEVEETPVATEEAAAEGTAETKEAPKAEK